METQNTPRKSKKGPIGVSYPKDKKLRERIVKKRVEGLKLKVEKLTVVIGEACQAVTS